MENNQNEESEVKSSLRRARSWALLGIASERRCPGRNGPIRGGCWYAFRYLTSGDHHHRGHEADAVPATGARQSSRRIRSHKLKSTGETLRRRFTKWRRPQ